MTSRALATLVPISSAPIFQPSSLARRKATAVRVDRSESFQAVSPIWRVLSCLRRNWKQWAEELPNGVGTGVPHGKVSSALQPAAESGHLTGAFDRAGAYLGALRK